MALCSRPSALHLRPRLAGRGQEQRRRHRRLAARNAVCSGCVGAVRSGPGTREVGGAQGVMVVSGGAVGIDAAAHRGAVAAGGRTVAILGCGLDVEYPRENRELFDNIVETGGALASEYSLGSQPEPWRIPSVR